LGGQEFIPSSLDKIVRLRRVLTERGLEQVQIAVDGGIHAQTAGPVARAGATVLVAGSAIFNDHGSVADNLRELRAAIGEAKTGSRR
jgi:ribulose-phosphate 3-epimerase